VEEYPTSEMRNSVILKKQCTKSVSPVYPGWVWWVFPLTRWVERQWPMLECTLDRVLENGFASSYVVVVLLAACYRHHHFCAQKATAAVLRQPYFHNWQLEESHREEKWVTWQWTHLTDRHGTQWSTLRPIHGDRCGSAGGAGGWASESTEAGNLFSIWKSDFGSKQQPPGSFGPTWGVVGSIDSMIANVWY
jgi:hypothetical protein